MEAETFAYLVQRFVTDWSRDQTAHTIRGVQAVDTTKPNDHLEPLLLLSGSGLQPWIWAAFINELPPGTPVGIGARPSGPDLILAAYVEHALASAPAEKFTVVGHSLGAVVGLAVASTAADRINGFVAVAGVVPSPPGSFLSAMPLPNRWMLSLGIRIAGTRPPDKMIRQSLGAGLSEPLLDRLVDEFQSDSAELFRSKITRTDQPHRRGYVLTANDPEMTTKLQDRFVTNLAPEWTTTLNTGHLPMLEDPSGLAAAVGDFTDNGHDG